MDGPDRHVLRYQSTAKASADAHALARSGLVGQIDVIVDLVALVLALVLFVSGNVLFGIAVAAIAVLSLAGTRVHPLQRLLIAIRYRSVLGNMTEVTVDDEGLRFENPFVSSFFPWSAITAVRSNHQSLAFLHRRVLLGYVPSLAFDSPAEQGRVATFARARIGPAEGR